MEIIRVRTERGDIVSYRRRKKLFKSGKKLDHFTYYDDRRREIEDSELLHYLFANQDEPLIYIK